MLYYWKCKLRWIFLYSFYLLHVISQSFSSIFILYSSIINFVFIINLVHYMKTGFDFIVFINSYFLSSGFWSLDSRMPLCRETFVSKLNRSCKSLCDNNRIWKVRWTLHPCHPLTTSFPGKHWKWILVWGHIFSSFSCTSVFSPPSLSLYSCLDSGALGNPGDRRWGPQIEDPIVVQREMHCGWICPVLCKSNTLFTWTNTSCGVSPLLPCAAFFP